MFAFHGWATIRFTPENRDIEDEDKLQDAAVEAVREYIRQTKLDAWGNVVVDVRWTNGAAHLWTAGFKNHATVGGDLLALCHHIAHVALGSYGQPYTRDDEDPAYENASRVYALARGALIEQSDPFLSPFVPTAEDPYSGS